MIHREVLGGSFIRIWRGRSRGFYTKTCSIEICQRYNKALQDRVLLRARYQSAATFSCCRWLWMNMVEYWVTVGEKT
jgi:hypothetical protein